MAQYAMPKEHQKDFTVFLVGQDGHGHWVVQENHGLVEGLFVSREDAIRFARDEHDKVRGSLVMLTPKPIAMHCAARAAAAR